MCLVKASPLHIQALGIILCTATATGNDTRKLTVCVQISYVMQDCAQVRTATLSKRYCICVLCNNSINLYSICSAVCTLSGVFHNIIIIIIIGPARVGRAERWVGLASCLARAKARSSS